MLNFWARRLLCISMALTVVVSAVSPLQAHDEKNVSKEDIEAHREADFGFQGFKKLNVELQKDYDEFDYAAAAAAYRQNAQSAAAGNGFKVGQWSPVFNLPLVPIHAAVLPNGKVLMWDSVGDLPTENYPTHNTTRALIWDPETGTFVRDDVYTGFNIFCAGHAALPDGTQFIAGGNKDSALNGLDTMHIFDSSNNSWSMIGRMTQGDRWYPSVTAMPNGEMLVTSGGPSTSEVYNAQTGIRSLTTAVLAMPLYPWLQAAPNGRAFYFGPDNNLRYLNTAGTGSWQNLGPRDGINRNYGSYAMYDIGKVVTTGGSSSIKHTAVIDFNGATPLVSRAGDLAAGRRQHNLTVLPDGTVLATGGNSSGASLVDVNAGVYTAELWNPSTGAWQTLSSMQKTRQYHSVSLLLPDGRVLSGGGGICGACYSQNYLEKNIEIFSPPYLFQRDGTPAPRPIIYSGPSAMAYAGTYTVSTDNPKNVKQVVLIRPSSVTHSVDFEQRRIPLAFANTRGTLRINAPAGAALAPPGYYMMFVIDSKGVPSVAKMVKLG